MKEKILPAWDRTFVAKKLSPQQPGARKLAQRYGQALVCVRHRQERDRSIRYTTVELVIEQSPIKRRKPDTQLLGVRVEKGEIELRRRILGAGGQWDPSIYAWWITRADARRLRVLKKVVATG